MTDHCPVCPVPGNPRCPGLKLRFGCQDIAAGNRTRADHFAYVAGLDPDQPVEIDPIHLMADLCPMGSGSCGCGPEPRTCSHPDRPEHVWRADCVRCLTPIAG